MGYIGQILGDIFGKTMGYTVPLDILNKTNGCLGNIMGYIGKQLWDILSDIFAKPWDRIYWYIGYIKEKLRDILGKIMGNILGKNYGIYYVIYFHKLWNIFDKN